MKRTSVLSQERIVFLRGVGSAKPAGIEDVSSNIASSVRWKLCELAEVPITGFRMSFKLTKFGMLVHSLSPSND